MIWDWEHESMPRERLEALQLHRLRVTLQRVYEKTPFYRRKLDEAGIKGGRINRLEDLRKLPFTTKEDLRDNYPFDMLAVPMDQVVRIHASSGTTGQPTVVAYTRNDVQTWAQVMARTLSLGGTTSGDIVHNAYGYGLFTGGLGVHYGAELVGAAVIPMSGGNTRRQIMIMKDFGSTVLTCTPSYALNMAEQAVELGVDFRDLKLKVGLFGAEPWSDTMRQEMEEKLGLDAIDIYGLSEVIGPGVSGECIEAKDGLHVSEDHFIPEIIDPDTGEVLPPGEFGELVFTTITKEAIPLIRYRTRDISCLNYEPCICGRSHVRMNRVSGRTDDMLIIRGVNVFPSQIESVLMGIQDIEPHYQIIVDREGTLDTLEVQVEMSERAFSDAIRNVEALSKQIAGDVRETLGLTAKITLVEPKTIARSEGKAQRVVDKRKG